MTLSTEQKKFLSEVLELEILLKSRTFGIPEEEVKTWNHLKKFTYIKYKDLLEDPLVMNEKLIQLRIELLFEE